MFLKIHSNIAVLINSRFKNNYRVCILHMYEKKSPFFICFLGCAVQSAAGKLDGRMLKEKEKSREIVAAQRRI